jgi:hypothetical protein
MKKFLTLLFPIIFFGGVVETHAQTFSDVPQSSQYYEAAEYLVEQGVLDKTKGTFRPNDTINRAEFTKIVILSRDQQYLPLTGGYNGYKIFTDIVMGSGDWFIDVIAQAKHHNIVGGYPDGSFRPGKNITLPEAMKIVLAANDLLEIEESKWDQRYKDDHENGWGQMPYREWYSAPLYYFENNILQQIENPSLSCHKFPAFCGQVISQYSIYSSFTLDHKVTRGEMIQIIYEMKKIQGSLYTQDKDFQKVEKNSLGIDYYGKIEVTGYIEGFDDVYENSTCLYGLEECVISTRLKQLNFKVIKTSNDEVFNEFLDWYHEGKQNPNNKTLMLGCMENDEKLIFNTFRFDEEDISVSASINSEFSGEKFLDLKNATKENPITLTVYKNLFPHMGTGQCYTFFEIID